MSDEERNNWILIKEKLEESGKPTTIFTNAPALLQMVVTILMTVASKPHNRTKPR